ncbi:MAG: OsmC family protein [Flavobacteriales bacterium]|nr:OsmC family protein [Flavobacteriales bacterium]MCL4281374.1 OsmC family protein [Flavobacteriales bacterium]
MERTSKAQWKGTLKEGSGSMSIPSGALASSPYTFLTRFENAKGTNPEELIGAAHAGCFAMMTSGLLTKAGHTPEQLDTEARVVLGEAGGLPTITDIHLKIHGKVPGIDEATFRTIAEDAKAKCPVSRLLTGAKIHLEITFG